MNWTEQNPNGISRLESSSTEINEITLDLKIVLSDTKEKLTNSKDKNINAILIYVDGTNGNVFCSGYESQNEKVYDKKGSELELNEFWNYCSDNGDGAIEFDEVIAESANHLLKSDFGRSLTEQFEIFLQGELDSPKKITT